jgi:acyl-CoA synthetase (AMP-forming)/AMP-acid ligase II
MLLVEELHTMAEAYGPETAYGVVGDGSLTFAAWDSQASALARGLVEAGVEPGDRVGICICAANALRFLVAYAAVHRAGAVAVPTNDRLAAAEIEAMVAHAEARALIAEGAVLSLGASLAEKGLTELLVDASLSHDPDACPKGAISWEELIGAGSGYFQVPRSEDDLADILYTSGTTGRPKGVAVHHAAASLIPFAGPPPWSGNGWLHASPMFTFAGISFVYNPMKLGMRGIYQPRFDARQWLQVVQAEKPTAVFLVPSMVQLLLACEEFEEADLSSIQICAIGSAPLAPFALERIQEKLPDAMVSSNYGMTEAGSVYAITPKGEAVRRPGTVGQIVPPAQVRIVGPQGEEMPVGETGEVQVLVPGKSREYYKDPEATRSTWRDGWLCTGDLGRLDADGYLYIVGRAKDVIIRGGNNIHAVDVENVILAHPDVAEAAVVGAPHPVLGEDPVGFVVLRPGASLTGDELRAFCLDRLADYKVPRRWVFRDGLPRNATGKVVKGDLRALLECLDD